MRRVANEGGLHMNDGPTFGLWYDFRQPVPFRQSYGSFYGECLEEIEEGERLGLSGVWLSEHHFVDDGYLPSPLVAAAAIAARTRNMTIGTNVLLLPMHHPLRVAEDAAVVDLISGGRFVLGVGLGYVQHEFEVLGFNRKHRPSLMEEGVAVIRQAWEEGRIGFSGRRWRFEDLPFEPRPGRRIPIYFGGYTEPAVDRAVRLADGFMAGGRKGAAEMYGLLQRKLKEHGRDPATFPLIASQAVYVHEDPERAWAEAAPCIAYQRNRYAEWGSGRDEPRPEPIGPGEVPREPYFVGSPDEVARDLIELYRQAPYEHLCFWGRLPGLSHEQALNSMRLFVERVAPAVRAAAGKA
ncbi:LLM class flavin-dependent oxidoreductase [Rubrobacter taiwanensis]|jgi:alkanesulfonate monooxygenase SsuD/methylene tetrahydromethanopterin reductase-like flavin-dependent oxidoreductase (luciferase family)|uniref:LLM class flavin-dependent oxidoreductase n=2 Tax=Rubrobacter taiwanensis TaxID=185139 RepID=A0A4R1B421_9ACTN|nr:LLM class flavin-dependent oxidoreductase [Rubrobacter taiwanensis]